jgi:hypothetical protein
MAAIPTPGNRKARVRAFFSSFAFIGLFPRDTFPQPGVEADPLVAGN